MEEINVDDFEIKLNRSLDGLGDRIIQKSQYSQLGKFLQRLTAEESRDFLFDNFLHVMEWQIPVEVSDKPHHETPEIIHSISLSGPMSDKLLQQFISESNARTIEKVKFATAVGIISGLVTSGLGGVIAMPTVLTASAKILWGCGLALHHVLDAKEQSNNSSLEKALKTRKVSYRFLDFNANDFDELATKYIQAIEPQFEYACSKTHRLLSLAKKKTNDTRGNEYGR